MKTILGTFLVLTLLVAFSRSQKPVKCSNSLQCYLHHPPPPGYCCCSKTDTCTTVFNCLKMKGSCLILPSSKDRSCSSLTLANYTWTFDSKQGDQSVEGITKKECAEKCLSNSWCSGWTWSKDDSSGSICHLFKTLKNQHKCDPCAECLSGKITHISGVCREKWIAAETTKTELDCLELCSMNSKCQYYSYATGSLFHKTCFLFSQCTPVKTCEKIESGKLDCIEPPSTKPGEALAVAGKLPDQCTNNNKLSKNNRMINFGSGTFSDRDGLGDDFSGAGFYKVTGQAGSELAAANPGGNKCGSVSTGYLKTSQRPGPGKTLHGVTVCFPYEKNNCQWNTTISITNCGSSFVYNLQEVPKVCPPCGHPKWCKPCKQYVPLRYCTQA